MSWSSNAVLTPQHLAAICVMLGFFLLIFFAGAERGIVGVKFGGSVFVLAISFAAVTYDVGFFVGSDIAFFTFFSLSEHFVFALQAIPFAVPVAIALAGYFGSWWLGRWRDSKLVEEPIAKINATSDAETKQAIAAPYLKKAERLKRWRPAINALMGVFTLLLIVASLGASQPV